MRTTYLFHVTGMRPYATDRWSKPYKTLAAAHAQVTRVLPRNVITGERVGDWSAAIYAIEDTPDGPVLRLLEIRS